MQPYNYIGNPDYRGWLAADPDKTWALEYAGNDGGYDVNKLRNANPSGVGVLGQTMQDWYKEYQGLTAPAAGGGTGAAAQPASNPDEIAYWGDQENSLRRLLDSTNVQKDNGFKSIDDSYNLSVDRTKQQQNQTLSGYATQRQDTLNDKRSALGKVDTNMRTGYESLQRTLGLKGSGISSAQKYAVPQALSRYGGQQRVQTNEQYGKNLRNIDTVETNAKSQYENTLADLLGQKQSKTQDFLTGILQQQANLNGQLSNAATQKAIAGGQNYQQAAGARAPYEQSVRNIQGEIDGLFGRYRTPQFQTQTVNPQAASMAQYTVDPLQLSQQQQNPGMGADVAAYLPFIRERQKGILGL